jgi:hypothetical protein
MSFSGILGALKDGDNEVIEGTFGRELKGLVGDGIEFKDSGFVGFVGVEEGTMGFALVDTAGLVEEDTMGFALVDTAGLVEEDTMGFAPTTGVAEADTAGLVEEGTMGFAPTAGFIPTGGLEFDVGIVFTFFLSIELDIIYYR